MFAAFNLYVVVLIVIKNDHEFFGLSKNLKTELKGAHNRSLRSDRARTCQYVE